MEGKQVTAEEKPFSLERAEEDDEFEEFERDGEERAAGVTSSLESRRNHPF